MPGREKLIAEHNCCLYRVSAVMGAGSLYQDVLNVSCTWEQHQHTSIRRQNRRMAQVNLGRFTIESSNNSNMYSKNSTFVEL